VDLFIFDMKNLIKYIIIVIVILLVNLSCTDNPFFTDQEFWSDKLVVRGKVELNNSSDYSGVYVWLEGLNASTYTNSEGKFDLKLPSPASLPGGAAAWNGVYKIYYYLANYEYQYSSVFIRNGKVEYGNNDVDESGNIKGNIQLRELLKIQTTIDPSSTRQDYLRGQTISIYLQTYAESVYLETFEPLTVNSVCIIFKKIDAPNTKSLFLLFNSTRFHTVVLSGISVWIMNFGGGESSPFTPIPIESGNYEVIPYLLIEQEGLPEELLLSISEYYNTFTSEYLKLPFKWDVVTFKVE